MAEFGSTTPWQILPLLLVIIIVVVSIIRHQEARRRQAQGVLWLQAMRLLLTHVQRHRGLSSGMLSGDGTLLAPMAEVQIQVSRDFELISGIGEWVKNHSGWLVITEHWARLAGNVARLSARQSIDQHNRLIKNILVFVDDIAQAHYLYPLSGNRTDVWRELLTLAEYVGQARALGTALAAGRAQGVDDDAQSHSRMALVDLHQVILRTLESPRYRRGIDAADLQNILDFLFYLDNKILRDGATVNAGDFYAEATCTLDRIYERFDEELTQANRRLSS